MKKLIILVATLLLIVVLLTACTQIKETPVEYKGLNGEVVSDLGKYGAERIIAAEFPNIDLNYKYMEIPSDNCYSIDTKLFLIFFWNNDDETVGGLWSYCYGWNEYGTIDDSWYLQESIVVW